MTGQDNMSQADMEQSVEQLEENIKAYENAVTNMKGNLRKLQSSIDSGGMESGTLETV